MVSGSVITLLCHVSACTPSRHMGEQVWGVKQAWACVVTAMHVEKPTEHTGTVLCTSVLVLLDSHNDMSRLVQTLASHDMPKVNCFSFAQRYGCVPAAPVHAQVGAAWLCAAAMASGFAPR